MKWYAVKKGKNPGLYNSWDECKKQVIGFPDAEYKSFENKSEAEDWLNEKEKPLEEVDGIAYVDGSFNEKAGLYGFGGFIIYKKEKDGKKEEFKTIVKGSGKNPDMMAMRNISGEILGSMEVVKIAIDLGLKSLRIYYDYKGIEMWAKGKWNRNRSGTEDYYKYMQSVKDKIHIDFVKVKGHTGVAGNEEADALAKEAVGIK